MKKRYFTDDISTESLEKTLVCFDPEFRSYERGETVLTYSDEAGRIGILLYGSAKLYYIDESGDTSLLESYHRGDVFGEMFSLPLQDFEYIVTAEEKCRVIYIDYKHLITPCEKSCEHHSALINNMFIMTAQRSQELSLHISFLNQHTTRKKLLAYFKYCQTSCGGTAGHPFEIPCSLGALAEYLCVDRVAMMKEIGRMKKDGLITSNRRQFILL